MHLGIFADYDYVYSVFKLYHFSLAIETTGIPNIDSRNPNSPKS